MIDIHSHLIYGVDDGSKTIEDSVEILESLYNNGITDIILTPHYIAETNYVSPKIDNIKKMGELKKRLKEKNIPLKLYLGNEIYIDNNILDYIYKKEMSSLNNTEYLLIELPMSGIYPDYVEIFENLIKLGCKVILAHPERYKTFQKDFNLILELNEIGVLFQCNIDSIIGAYGKEARKTMKLLLKNKLVSFVGTDIHHKKDNYNYIEKSIDKFKKYLSKDEIEDILNKNPKMIINK